MSIEKFGASLLDYEPCHYEPSKLTFRGPQKSLSDPYIAFVGTTETYGKFVAQPFPSLIELSLGQTCVNFGCVNAGSDVYLHEQSVLEKCAKARVTVLQVMGAHNMSNRFYSVHPRRNDRFLAASDAMKGIFPDFDFTDFTFTKHLLLALKTRAAERFQAVEKELQDAWVARMRTLADLIDGDVVLLWIDQSVAPGATTALGEEPRFVNSNMLDEVAPYFAEVVRVSPSVAAVAQGTKGMVFHPMEKLAAQGVIGAMTHEEVAVAVSEVLRDYI